MERRQKGQCTNCGAPVTLVHDSEHPTCRRDGKRYVDDRTPDRGSCLFRCRQCHAVIDSNWMPLADDTPPHGCGHMQGRGAA